VVLTPFVLPGETVRIETETESKGLLRGKPVEILTAAEERVKPPCQYFSRCGGCHYQQAPYERQLHYKRVILREVLRRVGKLTVDDIDVESAEPLGYRNRVQLHVADSRLGFHQAGTHELQPVLECPIAAPLINEALAALRRMAHQPRFPKFVRSIELFTNGEEVQLNVLDSSGKRLARGFFEWCAKQIPGADTPALNYKSGDDTFRVGHRSFFQVNRFLVERLTELALDEAEGKTALDLYAGVGLLTLPLRRRFTAVTAVESGRGAVEDLKHNAEAAGTPVNVERNTAELFLEEYQATPDFILADPPRAGLGKGVVKQLLRIKAPRLTVVSCDPSTLARDLASLIEGGYELQKMTLVDLFPQTYHIETVTTLAFRSQDG
jgi:23S rRNA (uracil1939-C5)-methyltransferase